MLCLCSLIPCCCDGACDDAVSVLLCAVLGDIAKASKRLIVSFSIAAVGDNFRAAESEIGSSGEDGELSADEGLIDAGSTGRGFRGGRDKGTVAVGTPVVGDDEDDIDVDVVSTRLVSASMDC